jgi:putative ABC transport system permease protein
MSGIMLIVFRSLRQHALSTVITVFSTALACGLVMGVFSVKTQTHEAFTGGPIGYDAVLGARGSQLQLVLNSVFHLETSPGNIPWAMYQALSKNPVVSYAIPYAVGDNYFGYRIVGTTEDIFNKFEYQEGKKFQLYDGRAFNPLKQEAVVGSFVAQKMHLKVNDIINPYHGLYFDEKKKHDAQYRVVGILEPTNTPSDRVIWIPIRGVWLMPGHVAHKGGAGGEAYVPDEGQEVPDEDKEISVVMLKLVNPDAGFNLYQQVNNQGDRATLAWPIGKVMAELFDKIGWIDHVLEMVAYLVIVVAAGSILASIYNTMNERRREFAILRALGARRATVFSAIVFEAATISLLGCIVGFLIYAVILSVAASIIRSQTGVVLDPFLYHPVLVFGPLGIVVLGAFAGLIPAMKAYGTDVATNLVPAS